MNIKFAIPTTQIFAEPFQWVDTAWYLQVTLDA